MCLGLVNVLCRTVDYVKTGITKNILHMREQVAYKGWIGNARREVHARVVLLNDGLGLAYTDSWSRAPTRSQRVASYTTR